MAQFYSHFVERGSTSINKMLRRIENYSVSIRLLFNISTPDELRSFLCKYANNDLVTLPHTEKEILLVIKRAFHEGMVQIVQEQLVKIYRLTTGLEEFSAKSGFSDKELVLLPIFQSLKNRVHSLVDIQQRIDSLEFGDMIETILLLDFEAIGSTSRRNVELILKAGKITKIVRRQLPWFMVTDRIISRSRAIVQATKTVASFFDSFGVIEPKGPSLVLSRGARSISNLGGNWLG